MSSKSYILKAESELRCEVSESGSLVVRLVSGSAEVFGVELAVRKDYVFSDDNIAIFTWYGCEVETRGEGATLYESDSTPMVSYVNTHMQLEARRDVALANSDSGPRVLVAGPADSGKYTTSRILTSYACRLDRSPILINLDPGQSGPHAIPGCIQATPLDKFSLNTEQGFEESNPLMYYFGYPSPKGNLDVYKKLATSLADKVDKKLNTDNYQLSSGFFVNTSGFIDGEEGFDALMHCIKAFAIDVVLVMGHDRLYSSLSSALPQEVTIAKLPRSGGVVQRDRQWRTRHRRLRLWEYFYGLKSSIPGQAPLLSPIRRDISLSSVRLIRAGGLQLSEGMRLIGESSENITCQLSIVPPTQELERSIIAVLHTNPEEEEALKTAEISGTIPQSLLYANVAGFVTVIQLNVEQDKMTILAPTSGPLPSKYLLTGSIRFDSDAVR